jgi:hypothetical protein
MVIDKRSKQYLIDKINSSDQIAKTVGHILDALAMADQIGKWVIIPEHPDSPIVLISHDPKLKEQILKLIDDNKPQT